VPFARSDNEGDAPSITTEETTSLAPASRRVAAAEFATLGHAAGAPHTACRRRDPASRRQCDRESWATIWAASDAASSDCTMRWCKLRPGAPVSNDLSFPGRFARPAAGARIRQIAIALLARNWKFESTPLQQRVCELSVPEWRTRRSSAHLPWQRRRASWRDRVSPRKPGWIAE
jgi:hypothetical protein